MCIQNQAVFFAQELHAAMAGFRTRNRALIRLVVTRCEVDMQEIKLQYQSLYQRPLEKDIKVCIVCVYLDSVTVVVVFLSL